MRVPRMRIIAGCARRATERGRESTEGMMGADTLRGGWRRAAQCVFLVAKSLLVSASVLVYVCDGNRELTRYCIVSRHLIRMFV